VCFDVSEGVNGAWRMVHSEREVECGRGGGIGSGGSGLRGVTRLVEVLHERGDDGWE
jgi:hypothetical protein